MPKPNSSDVDKECPVCGGLIWGGGQKVLLEGAKITVCDSCAEHGKKIRTYERQAHKKRPSQQRSSSGKTYRKKKSVFDSDIEVVPDYAKRVRRARTSRNLTQEKFAQRVHEKESLIRRIESGKTKPTIELAKKLENTYKIHLLQKSDKLEVKTSSYMKQKSGTTLGDIAFIKKKKDK
jgi:putative transcription factor